MAARVDAVVGQVVDVAKVDAGREPLLEIPECPADYRHLDTDGYTSFDVHPAFEKRTCLLTGRCASVTLAPTSQPARICAAV